MSPHRPCRQGLINCSLDHVWAEYSLRFFLEHGKLESWKGLLHRSLAGSLSCGRLLWGFPVHLLGSTEAWNFPLHPSLDSAALWNWLLSYRVAHHLCHVSSGPSSLVVSCGSRDIRNWHHADFTFALCVKEISEYMWACCVLYQPNLGHGAGQVF